MRRSTRSVLPILLAALAPVLASAAADVPARPSAGCARGSIERGDRLERTIRVGQVERAYVLDVPERIEPGAPLPLLLDFHGLGHSGAGVWRVSGFRELARREPFITVYPEGLPVRLETPGRVFDGAGWEVHSVAGNRDLELVARLLDRLESEYCIDRARIFATGFSNGAYLSQLLGCTMADRFAAIAPVSGGVLPVACTPSRPMPVLIHHGRQDELIDVVQGRRARDAWLRVDGCASVGTRDGASAATDPPSGAAEGPAGTDRTADAAGIACERSTGCRDGVVVEYCEGDFAHRWPASATLRVWEFLRIHPMPAAPDVLEAGADGGRASP